MFEQGTKTTLHNIKVTVFCGCLYCSADFRTKIRNKRIKSLVCCPDFLLISLTCNDIATFLAEFGYSKYLTCLIVRFGTLRWHIYQARFGLALGILPQLCLPKIPTIDCQAHLMCRRSVPKRYYQE